MSPKQCPFCGSPGATNVHPEIATMFIAGCSDADCIAHQVAYDFASEEAAVAAWNKRTRPTYRSPPSTFAERLAKACEANPYVPSSAFGGGQPWVRQRLEARFGISISPELVASWFSGEAQPSREERYQLAEVLETDC